MAARAASASRTAPPAPAFWLVGDTRPLESGRAESSTAATDIRPRYRPEQHRDVRHALQKSALVVSFSAMSSARNASSSAPARRIAALRSATGLLGLAILAWCATPLLNANADSTGSLQAQANAIAGQIASDNTALAQIGNEYLTAASAYHRELGT